MTSFIATLTAELRIDSPFVAVDRPRLSWTVQTDTEGWVQEWAELRRGDEVVRRAGRDSVLVDWPFTPLSPGERAEIQVRAGSASALATEWSAPLRIVSGIAPAWQAKPIALAAPASIAQPALLRRGFIPDRPVARATLFWTALGVTDMTLNGRPVDDAVLTPGWTTYQERLVYETSDVTALITEGENVLGASLAGGWYTEEYAVLTKPKRFYGDQPRLLAQLLLEYVDGTTQTIATDGTWRASGGGPVLASGIYAGEHADGRRRQHGWDAAGFDDSAWAPVIVTDDGLPALEARMAPPVRRTETLPVATAGTTPSGRILLDVGQNVVGRLRVRVTGPAGTVITIRHAEVLDAGDLARRPLRDAAATDSYTLAGDGVEVWEPQFTVAG